MKPLVIYHAHCTDGYGAAYAAWEKFGGDAEYLPMNYGDALDPSKIQYEDREVYILDFSLPKPIMENLTKTASRVVWLDHHKTAFEMWFGSFQPGDRIEVESSKLHIILDDNRSGALLAWEYFHPVVEVPSLIRHIDDRDRWVFKYMDSKAVHAGLATMKPWSFMQWRELNLERVIQVGQVILNKIEQEVKGAAKKTTRCTMMGLEGLAVNATTNLSEVGHELANMSGTYGMVYYIDADKRVKVSLRSNAEYDVSIIARFFNGGGHMNASGCEISVQQLMSILS